MLRAKWLNKEKKQKQSQTLFVINEQYYVSNISAKWPSQTHIEKS